MTYQRLSYEICTPQELGSSSHNMSIRALSSIEDLLLLSCRQHTAISVCDRTACLICDRRKRWSNSSPLPSFSFKLLANVNSPYSAPKSPILLPFTIAGSMFSGFTSQWMTHSRHSWWRYANAFAIPTASLNLSFHLRTPAVLWLLNKCLSIESLSTYS